MTFWQDESGVVTTDWIVLTAAIGGICLSAVVSIRGGVEALAFGVEQSLSGAQVTGLGTLGFVNYTAPDLMILGGPNFGDVTGNLRSTLQAMSDTDLRTFAELHAQNVADDPVCAGVRSCAIDIDHIALALTELQTRQAPPTLVEDVDQIYQAARSRWP